MSNSIIVRGWYIFRNEGLALFLKRVLLFIRFFIEHESFYLYEHRLIARNESNFLPKIKNFKTEIISSNQQANTLISDGFELYPDVTNFEKRLDKGAIAFCVFVGHELAHIGWVAISKEARNSVDPVPFEVDISGREACTGGTWTNPKYRGSGLMVYGYFKRFEFLRGKGKLISRNSVATNNTISQKAHAKFNPKIYARVRSIRIGSWVSWKETPLININY